MVTVASKATVIEAGVNRASLTDLTVKAPNAQTATYQYGAVSVLSPIPLPMIGCALNDGQNSWQCVSALVSWPIAIGPEKLGLVSGGEVEAGAVGRLIGLTPRTVTVTHPAGYMELPMGEADLSQVERIN
jgi:hypothetical protein